MLIPDSYIFDMDGTLWDAVDSYCRVWNTTIEQTGINAPEVSRKTLADLMGKPLDIIYMTLVGDALRKDRFMTVLLNNERIMMPSLGGILYPDVKQTLAELHRRGAALFMVSNCEASGLPNFLRFSGMTDLFTDTLSFGQTDCEKDVNIATLVKRYNLQTPVYIGDTEGDCRSTHAAGLPFVWAAYGFGKNVPDADYTILSISDLLNIFPQQ